MKPEDVPLQVYKPLRNKYMDEMFKIIRAVMVAIMYRNIPLPAK